MKVLIVLALAVARASAAILNALEQPSFAAGRIINGEVANKWEAPFIVSLKAGSHFCGGSIINEHWVLTAAHCLAYDKFSVVAGLHSRNDESQVQIRQVHSKSQQIVHEKYGGRVGPYDIGLIRIDLPFNLNTLTRDGDAPVAKVALPSGKYSIDGEGWLFGWGLDSSNILPNELHKLKADVFNYTDCKKAMPIYSPIHESNICIHRVNKTDGACNGDSGGPLIRKNPDGIELVGIVSWGYTPCQTTTRPSVFTAVDYHMDWISEKLNTFKFADYPV